MSINEQAFGISRRVAPGPLALNEAASSPAIPRRGFLLGAAAAVSVTVGMNVDVLARYAKAQADNDAAAQRLRAITDREIAEARAANKLALNKAAADKFIALQEIEEQRAKYGAYKYSDTIGFSEMKREFPWLESTRKSVAFVRAGNEAGSAVLLDNNGTIALCAHEITGRNKGKIRLFFNKNENGVLIELKPYNFIFNRKHDLMFATIDPALVRKHGLLPAKWGQLGYRNIDDAARIAGGGDIICVGWPTPSFRFHATRAVLSGITLKNAYRNGAGSNIVLSCKVKAKGVTFGGMSGGGVFRNQKLVGIINASTAPGTDAVTDFTPIDLIRETYIRLYPRRARAAGIRQIADSDTPSECLIEDSDLVRLVPSE